MFFDLTLPIRKDDADGTASERDRVIMRLGHYGTHLDKVCGSTVPLEYVRSRGLMFDVSAFSRTRTVEWEDIPGSLVEPADFVIFRTGALLRNPYGSKGYLEEFFELSHEVIDRLIACRIRFIGLDARGVRRGEEHRKADARCERGGVYVIENITGTEQLPVSVPFVVYTACFDSGGSGVPCRVIAEITAAPDHTL